MVIVYCKRKDEDESNHFVHYHFAMNDKFCHQVRDPGKDASLDEHLDQVFHLACKHSIIPGCTKQLELLCTDTGYLPQVSHTAEEIGLSESVYTGTNAQLEVIFC